MRQLLPDPAGKSPMVLELPEAGCLVATPCTLRVTAAAPARLDRAEPIVLTRSGGLEILSLSPEPSASGSAGDTGGSIAWLVRVIAFDSGEMMTPALQFQVSKGGARPQLAMAPTARLQVAEPSLPAGAELSDIEGPLPIGMTIADAGVTVGVVIAFLIIAIGLTWWLRRWFSTGTRRARFGPGAAALSRRRAARALKRLRRRAGRERPSLVYSNMVTILRRTMVPRLGDLALSSTSSELVTLIQQQSTTTLAHEQVAPLLAVSDRVKFAGFRPAADELVADCSRAIELVRGLERAGLTRVPAPPRP